MPDNKKNSVIDESFTDFGWSEMSKLLDKEMPVETPAKKRRFWLLLLLIGLVLGGFGTVWGVQNRMDNRQQEESGLQTNPPVADLTPAQTEPIDEAAISVATHEPEKNLIDFTTTINPAFPVEERPQQQMTRDITALESTLNDQDIISTTLGKTEDARPIEESAVTNFNEPLVKQESFAEISPLEDDVALLHYSSGLQDALPASAKKTPSAFTRFITPARVGVEGGIFTNQFNQIDGLHLGLAVKYNLGASRWNLNTGLAYAIQHQPFRYGRWNSSSFDEVNPGTFDPTTDIENNAQDTTISTVSDPEAAFVYQLDSLRTDFSTTIQRLELPLLIAFQADERLSLDFGAHFSYVLAAQYNGIHNGLKLSDALNSFVLSNRAYADTSEDYFSAKSVNRFGVALRGGLSYFPSKNLGLKLDYQFGLFNSSKSERYFSYNRAVRFSTVYYF